MKAKYITLGVCLLFSLNGYAQSSNRNYILTRTYTDGSVSTYLDEIQYFDGLGRPVQTVQKGITPGKNDLVTYQQYDSFGRDSCAWLPRVATGNSGNFVSFDAFTGLPSDIYQSDAKPYSKPVYEASPLNRILEQYGPGQNWYNYSRAVKTRYLINSDNDNAVLRCHQYKVTGSGTSTALQHPVNAPTNGYYTENQLYVTETTDENGNKSYEFKDRQGQVLLIRQMNGTTPHDTYCIYDNFGNLCYMLPPALVDKLATGAGLSDDGTEMKQYAYLYKYDGQRRCVRKRLPGCDWIEYVYDKAGRLILSQDGEQRLKSPKQWSINKYDALGRLIYTGLINREVAESEKNIIRNNVITETFTDEQTVTGGYTCNFFINEVTLLLANYYDDYRFLSLPGFEAMGYVSAIAEYHTRYGADASLIAAKGLLTGTITAVLDDSGTYLYGANYYDYRGRLIQSKSTNITNTQILLERKAYNFMGQVVSEHECFKMTTGTQAILNIDLNPIKQTYAYDHAGRMKNHKIYVTSLTSPVGERVQAYDSLGRVASVQTVTGVGVNGFLTTTYQYNIRSWVTKLENPLFKQTVSYACNGNIGGYSWKNGNYQGYFGFEYDGLNRLTCLNHYDGIYREYDENYYETTDYYPYSPGWYAYDKNGNITSMVNGDYDALTYVYSGNQMKKVNDGGATTTSSAAFDFKNYANVNEEYAYNKNGSMTKDLNKGISEIKYNVLNLPSQIDIVSPVAEARDKYVYSARGQKLRVIQQYNPNFQTSPVIGSAVNAAALTSTKTINYVGRRVDGRILFDDGYYSVGQYYRYLRDYQGNIRAVHNAGGVYQRTDYFPFGRPFVYYGLSPTYQPYKYNGKEFETQHGLNLLDYHARQYDPATGRFLTMDPLAEKYPWISGYAYCENNPINRIDPDGQRARPAPNVRPIPGRYRNNTRYMNAYPDGIRPPSIVRSTITEYSINPSYIPSPISDYTTPSGTTVQITSNNLSGQKLSLLVDLAGTVVQEINNKFTIHTSNGPTEKSSTDIRFSNQAIQTKFNAMQNEYEKQFDTKFSKLNETSMSENGGKLNTLDFFTNMSTVMKELGASPQSQILDFINQNRDNFQGTSSSYKYEIPEWRQGNNFE